MIEAVAQSWLGLLCLAIPGVRHAQVVLGGAPAAIARWPSGSAGTPGLAQAADEAMRQGEAVVRGHAARPSNPTGRSEIAVSFGPGEARRGAIAVEVVHRRQWDAEPSCKAVVDLLLSAAASFESVASEAAAKQRLVTVLELHGRVLEIDRFDDACKALVTELATRVGCERVSLGLLRDRTMRLHAVSHSARFDPRSSVSADLERAMEEAADQDARLAVPPPPDAPTRVTLAHEALAAKHGAGAVCTVPLSDGGEVIGALCFERRPGRGMDPETVRLCEDVALLLGPVLHLKRQAQSGWFARVRTAARAWRAKLTGPGHAEFKLGVLAFVLALTLLGFAKGEYRVAADARLEGRVQRAIVAGTDGYIAEAMVRAGDVVARGQVLARLQDRELRLELRSVEARQAQLEKQYREARALGDRSEANILAAQIDQAAAQAALLQTKLAHTRLIAPFDGVVVEGDLSHALGSPVERGQLLFELAPLDGYRIILEVDERDIAHTRPGQAGQLALSALPNATLGLTIERVTPVSVAADGRNTFRVEARLDAPVEGLRPGMEGVGKIAVDQRSWWWIWTHELTGWLRLWAWRWLP